MRLRRLYGPALLLVGLVPGAVLTVSTLGVPEAGAQGAQLTTQERILAAIPDDPAVLINAAYGDMPSTPDILELGKRSTKALERCLSDNVDENNRMLCAVVLQALGDRRALGTLQAALDDWDAGVRHRVVRALATVPDPSSVDPLIKLFRRTDEESNVRYAVLETLGAISDQRVVRFLRDELHKKKGEDDEAGIDFRPAVFDALWQNRHLTARETLVADTRDALESDNQSLQLAATFASAELRSPRLVPALVKLMEHPDVEVRNKAVYALGKIGDKTATKALLDHLPNVRESRMLNNIAFALERLDKKAFYTTIAQIIGHKQAVIRLNAAFVLGDVRHPEGLPLLENALGDASDFVRTSAIVAVTKVGQNDAAERKRALDDLGKYVDDANVNVKVEAVLGVHRLTENGRADLVYSELFTGLDPDLHPEPIQRAALELAERGDPRVRDWVASCVIRRGCDLDALAKWVEAKDPDVAGRLLLAWSRGDARLTDTVAELKPPGTLPVAKSALLDAGAYPDMFRLTSAALLGSVGDASVLPLLQEHASAKHASERIHGLVAATRLGDDAAGQRLLAELDTLPAEWLPGYVRAVGRIAEPAVRAKLLPALLAKQKDADPNIALAAAAIQLRWDPDAAIFRFLDALASPSSFERALAERYLMRADERRVTWLLRRMLAREGREDVRDRLRALLDQR